MTLLSLSGNKLKSFDPENYNFKIIISLDISNNNIVILPKWINKCTNLQKLYCENNNIERLLENMPNSLQELYCYYNKITKLGNFPTNLQILYCANNQITKLENLPTSLQELYCSHNQITKLENLPTSLQEFKCYSKPILNMAIKSIIKYKQFTLKSIMTDYFLSL